MLLRKAQGGGSIGPYAWENDGDVVEVPDEMGMQLLAIKGGGFEHVAEMPEPAKPKRRKAAAAKASGTDGADDGGGDPDEDPAAGGSDDGDPAGDDTDPAEGAEGADNS